MTFENPEAPEEKQIYSSDEAGLREAAQNHFGADDGEPTEVKVSDDAPAELTARQAADELTKHRQQVEDERKAVEVAMGLHNVDPSEQERLEQRVGKTNSRSNLY